MHLTFSYVGSLDKHPPFARFDIRDHVCLQLGGFKHGQVVRDYGRKPVRELVAIGVKLCEGRPQLWFQPRYMTRPAAFAFPGASAARLAEMLAPRDNTTQALREVSPNDFDLVEEPSEEVLRLCHRCRLPVGNLAYAGEASDEAIMHGECTAQAMLQKWNLAEVSRQDIAAARKSARREEYAIGWRIDDIPRNHDYLAKLGFEPPTCNTNTLCCLVLDENTWSVGVGSTAEPAAAVNLNYLSTALRVRLLEGREPYFSLDPACLSAPNTDCDDALADGKQGKRFSPEWLVGTAAGEVLFQADYHLKELSMGMHPQPVVGMRSCVDLAEDAREDKWLQWTAREWFVVRDAEVVMTDDNVLIPHVAMGIEAREQVAGPDGIEDAPLTRADHPLVKYAEEFSRNFDLIAERKSVIYHLRELAKASVLAKFLTETSFCVYGEWCKLEEEREMACSLEIPQLWNERLLHSHVQVQDGAIVNREDEDLVAKRCMVYGGVHFGLERFSVSPKADMLPAGQVVLMGQQLPTFTQPPRGTLSGAVQTRAIPGLLSFRRAPGLGTGGTQPQAQMEVLQYQDPPPVPGAVSKTAYTAMWKHAMLSPDSVYVPSPFMRFSQVEQTPPKRLTGATPKRDVGGVDLSLDRFALSEIRVAGCALTEAVGEASLGKLFWDGVDETVGDTFPSEAKLFLREVFNRCLSDRRGECHSVFVPPETSAPYVRHLQCLVIEEKVCRERRRRHFCDRAFSVEDPGPLFPATWKASFEISRVQRPRVSHESHRRNSVWHERPDYMCQAALLESVVQTAAPELDKRTEDGSRFRIYKFGDLEIRTVQERDAAEVVGAVFSTHPVPHPREVCSGATTSEDCAVDDVCVVRAIEYVERVRTPYVDSADTVPAYHTYVVLEIENGTVIVTEMKHDGSITWETEPSGLEMRSSLARVLSSSSSATSMSLKEQLKERVQTATVSALRQHRVKAESEVHSAAVEGVVPCWYRRRYVSEVCFMARGCRREEFGFEDGEGQKT